MTLVIRDPPEWRAEPTQDDYIAREERTSQLYALWLANGDAARAQLIYAERHVFWTAQRRQCRGPWPVEPQWVTPAAQVRGRFAR